MSFTSPEKRGCRLDRPCFASRRIRRKVSRLVPIFEFADSYDTAPRGNAAKFRPCTHERKAALSEVCPWPNRLRASPLLPIDRSPLFHPANLANAEPRRAKELLFSSRFSRCPRCQIHADEQNQARSGTATDLQQLRRATTGCTAKNHVRAHSSGQKQVPVPTQIQHL